MYNLEEEQRILAACGNKKRDESKEKVKSSTLIEPAASTTDELNSRLLRSAILQDERDAKSLILMKNYHCR